MFKISHEKKRISLRCATCRFFRAIRVTHFWRWFCFGWNPTHKTSEGSGILEPDFKGATGKRSLHQGVLSVTSDEPSCHVLLDQGTERGSAVGQSSGTRLYYSICARLYGSGATAFLREDGRLRGFCFSWNPWGVKVGLKKPWLIFLDMIFSMSRRIIMV